MRCARRWLGGGAPARAEPVELPTFGSEGVLPGVDLDDSASLLDLMDERR